MPAMHLPDDAQIVGQAVKVVKTLKKLDISYNRIGKRQQYIDSWLRFKGTESRDVNCQEVVLIGKALASTCGASQ